MKLFHNLATVGIIVLGLIAGTQAQSWEVDRGHSSVEFAVRHMVVSKVTGDFNEFEGTITNFDGKTVAGASVEFTVQTTSIDTKSEKRDGHLRSADFFAADSFPTFTFKSDTIVPGEGNNFQIQGDLTIRGVTKPVTFDAEYLGVIDAFGGQRAGFTATTKINRKDFGVNWSKSLDGGGLVVSEEVEIVLNIESVKVEPQG